MWPRLCIWNRSYLRLSKRTRDVRREKKPKRTNNNNNNNSIRIIVIFCQLKSYLTAHKNKKTQQLYCDFVEKMVRNILTGHKGGACRDDGSARQENARDGYSELRTVLTMQGHHCPATNVTMRWRHSLMLRRIVWKCSFHRDRLFHSPIVIGMFISYIV